VSTSNVELMTAAYRALSRRDPDWLIAHSDPGVELHMYGVAGEAVLYAGSSGIREYFRDLDEIWESGEYVPEDMRDLGDRIVVIVRQRLRGRGSGIDVESTVGCVCRLRGDLLTEMRAYDDPEEALAAVGLEA
jgi:ketosteroid isomerase-like protein